MPKYYISTGGNQEIVVADNAIDAAVEAIRRIYNKGATALGWITHISEAGFDMQPEDGDGEIDHYTLTQLLLEKAGLADQYKIDDYNTEDEE